MSTLAIKKLILPVLGAFLFNFASLAQAQSCGRTTCWDACSGNWVTVLGNACATGWDVGRGCYGAQGRCDLRSEACAVGVNCWDHCSASYVHLPHGNTCTIGWNSGLGCYQAVAECQ